jgi:Phage tail sheath protein FI
MHHGRDARLLIKPDSTAAALFGLESVTKVGDSPIGTSGDPAEDTYGRINGDSNSTGAVTFTINADSAGIDGNATQVVIENNIREGNFILQIYNNGVEVETWGGLTKDENSRFYVETFLSLVSDWIRVSDNTANSAPPLDGTYRLEGGSDGIPSDPDMQDELIIGNRVGYSGMYALSEPEQIDLDLIAVPGHSSTAVVTALLDLCQNVRMDCLAIIDPPFGLTVKEIVHWQNGSHPLNTVRFDSDFGALYWPWVKIRDNFNRVDIWAPPSGSVMATIARSDQLSAPWFAPAGVNRGNVPNITDVFSRPTLEERDLMYGYRNAINPIVQFVDFDGFVIWGQKTLQRRPTALDRVNVRRLMFVIEKRIRAASRQLLFDPHDDILRQKFVRISTAILSEIQVGRGVNDFRVKCDEELNTADVIDRNEMRARIGVQPIRAAEFIFIEFSIHRTGSFGENADTF